MPRIIPFALVLALLIPEFSSAYVIPHPNQRPERPSPRVEIVRNAKGQPIRSSRGTLLQRYRPDLPDDRLIKPSRRQMDQLKEARMIHIRKEQSRTYRMERATQRMEQITSSATILGKKVDLPRPSRP